MLAAYIVTQKSECWKNLLLHVIDSICFSNIRNDKQSFMQKEYKTNPISTNLCLQMISSLNFLSCIVVAFYKICSGIFDSMYFPSFFIVVFDFFELQNLPVLKTRRVQRETDYYIRKCTCPSVFKFRWAQRFTHFRSYGCIWVLSIHGILHGSTCFQFCMHDLLDYERNFVWKYIS